MAKWTRVTLGLHLGWTETPAQSVRWHQQGVPAHCPLSWPPNPWRGGVGDPIGWLCVGARPAVECTGNPTYVYPFYLRLHVCPFSLPSGPVSLPLPFEMESGEVSIPQSTQYLAAFNKVCWERLKEMKGLGIIDDLLFLFPFY